MSDAQADASLPCEPQRAMTPTHPDLAVLARMISRRHGLLWGLNSHMNLGVRSTSDTGGTEVVSPGVQVEAMSAIESAFVNTVLDRENLSTKEWDCSSGDSRNRKRSQCAQQDTTEKRIFALRMWSSRSAGWDKSGYVLAFPLNANRVS